MRPYHGPDQLGEGEVPAWAPSSSTLISGSTEEVLIDALLTFENADQKREAGIAGIEAVAALNPKIVVASHKSVGTADLPENGDRDQPHTRWISARAEVARRT